MDYEQMLHRYRTDPAWGDAVRYTAQRGIPLGLFLGRDPLEAGWTAHDRDIALFWQRMQDEQCRDCGTRDEEWDPRLGGDIDAYMAAVGRCRGCELIEAKQQEHSALHSGEHGVKFALVRPAADG